MSVKEIVGAVFGEAWTPSDTAVIERSPRGFQVGVSGDVALGYEDGTSCVFPACLAGIIHPHNDFTKVLATGTTATNIVVLY